MLNSNLCILCGFFILLFFSSCKSQDQSTNTEEKPNILFVLVDDLRWDEYGYVGHNYIKTPNIDRIAKEGIIFENAFATTPLCSPSRASFLTGQYAHTHGITDNIDRSIQSHQLVTYPMKLDSMGYETAFIGKWHMGNDNSRRPGFDYWAALQGQGEAFDPVFNENGTELSKEGYVTDILTNYSIDFIKSKPEKTPFLLYLSHKALHPNLHQDETGKVTKIEGGGFIPADRHKQMYQDAIFDRRPNSFITPYDKPALMRKFPGLPDLGKETGTPEEVIQKRAEMLMAIDESLGKILDQLEKTGELQNTIIVFAGDHGYWYGEHGLNEERRLAYEEGLRIPLIVRYPPLINPGQKCDKIVLNIDIAPSLIELAGGIPSKNIEGRSIIPLLQGDSPVDWRSSFLMEYYSDTVWPRTVNIGYKGIRSERFKYIQYTELSGMDEFYDLKDDPYELKNQIDNPKFEPIIQQMKNEIDSYY